MYLSKEVVVQEKDASEAQEEDGMDLGQRKVCPWGMGGTLTHTHKSTSQPFDAQALQYQQTTISRLQH